MKNYTQLTESERNQIYTLKLAGFKPSAISLQLNRHPSTIYIELRRNRGLRGYRPRQAQQMADNRRREKAKPKIPEETWCIVNNLIEKDWIPEQISGWLAAEKNVRISHERIYQHIARDRKQGGSLHLHLRCRKKKRKRYGGSDRRGQIKNRMSIEKRPDIVEERSRIGDWEVDTALFLSLWLNGSPVSASSPLRRTNGPTVSHRPLSERCSLTKNKFTP